MSLRLTFDFSLRQKWSASVVEDVVCHFAVCRCGLTLPVEAFVEVVVLCLWVELELRRLMLDDVV